MTETGARMKAYARKASVLWIGAGQRGKGIINLPGAALNLAFSAASGNIERRGTCPPELVAAAQAGSFAQTLANELAEAGYNPRQIDTTAAVTLEDSASGWTLTQIHLEVIATVPGVKECDFVDAALRAKAHCPISRALNANISMRATLSREEAPQETKPSPKSRKPRSDKARQNRLPGKAVSKSKPRGQGVSSGGMI
jgi:osmotically inducible protein OsmC